MREKGRQENTGYKVPPSNADTTKLFPPPPTFLYLYI